MLLTIEKSVTLRHPMTEVWELVRDARRVSACVPGVSDLVETGEPGGYRATVSDKLGPFRLTVPVTVQVDEDPATHRIKARATGDDRGGHARVRGEMSVSVDVADPGADAANPGAQLVVSSSIEVLGRLASLGAIPMKRRADQIFEQFVRNVESALAAGTPASSGNLA
jgi:carbon monoxide dehydrogenase subunit G